MMPVIQVMLQVAPHIALGLASGRLERVGSVIRDSASKQIVGWLREGGQIESNPDPASALPRFLFQNLLQAANLAKSGDVVQQVTALSKLGSSLSTISSVFGALNIAATAQSHHLITLRLQAIQNMLAFSTRLSMLQFSLSGFGLLMMLKRFADIESLLDKVYEQVSKAIAEQHKRDRQINLNVALESAQVVTNSEDGNYRESMAASLDFLLINAREHCLSDFLTKRNEESKQEIELAQQRLMQAMHLDETRIRIFLEVGQDKLAHSVMQDRLEYYRKQTRNYIGILLGRPWQRAVYFNHKVSDQDLQRYVLIEQWLRDKEDILWDIVLEQRKQFWTSEAKSALEPPPGIVLPGKSPPKAPTTHLDALAQAEIAIENFQRFEGFALELKAIHRLGISLADWEAMRNTQNTVFANKANINLAEHDDYVLLVDKEWLDEQPKETAA